MDIRNETEIEGFAQFIRNLCGAESKEGATRRRQLHAVVNNAGVALGGPVEDTSISVFRNVFEINYFGLVSFTQKMLRDLIRDKGRLFIVGSMAGRIALPFLSPYASSKFALEGFTDSLRREVAQFGVSVTLFEPGGIATPIWAKAKGQDRSFVSQKYLESLELFEKKFIDSGLEGFSADLAARRMFREIERRHPARRRIIDGKPAVDRLMTMLPASLIDAFTAKRFALSPKDRIRRLSSRE
jgi:NAD(P)-dependent dehydrogenase (short-subunit alcohol dehydrogenase family)